MDKVVIFGDDHSFHLTSLLENLPVLGTEEAKILNVYRPALTKVTQPSGKSRGSWASTQTGEGELRVATYAASVG